MELFQSDITGKLKSGDYMQMRVSKWQKKVLTGDLSGNGMEGDFLCKINLILN